MLYRSSGCIQPNFVINVCYITNPNLPDVAAAQVRDLDKEKHWNLRLEQYPSSCHTKVAMQTQRSLAWFRVGGSVGDSDAAVAVEDSRSLTAEGCWLGSPSLHRQFRLAILVHESLELLVAKVIIVFGWSRDRKQDRVRTSISRISSRRSLPESLSYHHSSIKTAPTKREPASSLCPFGQLGASWWARLRLGSVGVASGGRVTVARLTKGSNPGLTLLEL